MINVTPYGTNIPSSPCVGNSCKPQETAECPKPENGSPVAQESDDAVSCEISEEAKILNEKMRTEG